MMDVKSLIASMVGGFITVALASLVLSKNSKAPALISETFKGFANTLAVAKSDNPKTGM